MPEETVACPKCGTRIPLTSVVTAAIEARLRKQIEADVERREVEVAQREAAAKASERKFEDRVEELAGKRVKELTAKLTERVRREVEDEKEAAFVELQGRLKLRDTRLKEFEKRERELVAKSEDLEERERRLDLRVKELLNEERESLVEKIRKEEEAKFVEKGHELEELSGRLEANEKRLKSYEKRERELVARHEELEEKGRRLDLDAKRAVDAERGVLIDKIRKEEAEKSADQRRELSEMTNRLEVSERRLKEMDKREKEFLVKDEELQERERRLALDAKRALTVERDALVEKVKQEESERWEPQLREKAAELERVKQALERAQKAGSSGELAGEVAERTLVERLTDAFEEDQITPVGKGKRGADVLQILQAGGSILWESKDRYENWSNEWLPKLKRDRDEAKASVGVLVTTVGPGSKPVQGPTYEDGVVVTPPWAVVGVASLLRPLIGENARQRRLYDKRESLQAAVYAWVTSEAFKNGIVALAENLQALDREVARARINHARWFKRMEIGVERTARALGEFYGFAQGQAGLPDLPVLALEAGSQNPPDTTNGGTMTGEDPDDHSETQ